MEVCLVTLPRPYQFVIHLFSKRPFFLNPAQDAPKEGEDKTVMYNRKFGAQRVAQMLPRMTQAIHTFIHIIRQDTDSPLTRSRSLQVFAGLGIKYSMGGRTGNTVDCECANPYKHSAPKLSVLLSLSSLLVDNSHYHVTRPSLISPSLSLSPPRSAPPHHLGGAAKPGAAEQARGGPLRRLLLPREGAAAPSLHGPRPPKSPFPSLP